MVNLFEKTDKILYELQLKCVCVWGGGARKYIT